MNKVTATLASLGLAAALAAPSGARAEMSDTTKIIGGIAAAAIIAGIIDHKNDRRRGDDAETVSRAGRLGTIEQSAVTDYDGRRVIDGRIVPYGQKGPKAGRGYKKLPLPEVCLRTVETARGDRLAYTSDCLDRRYKFASKLPESCETLVRTRRGLHAVYGARCLERDGWQVARR